MQGSHRGRNPAPDIKDRAGPAATSTPPPSSLTSVVSPGPATPVLLHLHLSLADRGSLACGRGEGVESCHGDA